MSAFEGSRSVLTDPKNSTGPESICSLKNLDYRWEVYSTDKELPSYGWFDFDPKWPQMTLKYNKNKPPESHLRIVSETKKISPKYHQNFTKIIQNLVAVQISSLFR